MAHLLIIRGLPGSGKSTFAKMLNRAHYEADQFFTDPSTGEYRFDATKLGAAHRTCMQNVFDALDLDLDVTVANTFTTLQEMRPYIHFCNDNDHTFTVIKCEGSYGSVHNVPEEAMCRMRARWQDY